MLEILTAAVPHYPWPEAMERPSRAEIESLIAGLIDYLDREDGDADFEPGSDNEDGADAEPLMAARVAAASQILWAGFEGGMAA